MKRRSFLKITLPVLACNQLIARSAVPEKPEVVFGVIADPQYADIDKRGSRYYRNSIKKLTTAVKELNKHELNFTVTLGDLIETDIASFADIMPIYAKAKAPQTFVLGNHDFSVTDKDKDKVLKAVGLESSYYSKSIGDWVFLYLDSNDVSIYRYPKDSEQCKAATKLLARHQKNKLIQAKRWNGAIGSEQLAWLTEQLETAKESKKRVIIFNHAPVVPLNDIHNLWNNEVVVDLIAKHPNVVAYMNGHNHKGNFETHEGCHYVNFKGMVEKEKSSPFAIVKCFADRLEINGFDPEPARNLKVAQEKKAVTQ